MGRHFFKRYYLYSLLIAFIASSLALLYFIYQSTEHHLIYTLDDPYIHMSIAKNFSSANVWGITEYGFTSCSSSPLWTLLISLSYLVMGVNSYTPLALNLIISLFIVAFSYASFRKIHLSRLEAFIFCFLIIFLTPLPVLIFTGLEHTLHILLTLMVFYFLFNLLREPCPRRYLPYLLFTAPLLIATRLEGVFLIAIIFLVFIIRKPIFSILLIFFAAAPILAMGYLSLHAGWFFLPNSILLKSPKIDFISFDSIIFLLQGFWHQFLAVPHLIALMVFCVWAFIHINEAARRIYRIVLSVFLLCCFLHLTFSDVGWFYRYEAYLVAAGLYISAYIWPRLKPLPRKAVLLFFILFLLIFPTIRTIKAFKNTPIAAKNIYEQQYQIGRFIKTFYSNKRIAVNDIGVVNYIADFRCFDLWGLANMTTAKARMHGNMNPKFLYSFASKNKIKIAIVYDKFFLPYGGFPSNWIKAGTWTIPDNRFNGSSTVSFYSIGKKNLSFLKKNFKWFKTALPKDVKVTHF